jgi:hypothetical protein
MSKGALEDLLCSGLPINSRTILGVTLSILGNVLPILLTRFLSSKAKSRRKRRRAGGKKISVSSIESNK